VVDNDNTYSMPDFIRYDVRDRASWEFYRERMTPAGMLNRDAFEAACRPFDDRDWPLMINVTGVYYFLRKLMGTEELSLMFYDDPELIHYMVGWHLDFCRKYIFPVIERVRPEIVNMNEDVCFRSGLLLAPDLFKTIAGPQYTAVAEVARSCGVDSLSVDSDGLVEDFVPLATAYGVNTFYPFEVKAGNDLFEMRRKFPKLIFAGWLEKEVMNEGNEHRIEVEIASKVPALLKEGGYFPNADHSLQPPVTFPNLCKFMTCLHEVCGNPEGKFPRM